MQLIRGLHGGQLEALRGKVSMQAHALEILSRHLGAVSEYIAQADVEALVKHYSIPFNIVTAHASLWITSVEQFVDGCMEYLELLQSRGMTSYKLVPLTATMTSLSTIKGNYETRVLRGDTFIVPAFRSRITLECIDDLWRGKDVVNKLVDSRWPLSQLRAAKEE